MNRHLLLPLALSVAALTGCAEFSAGGTGVEPNYSSDADTNLQRGNEALESKNFLEAERYFEYVKGKYPFLEASKEAELRLADTDFDRERYVEARDRYQSFVKLHPTHPKVDYAAFRAALTHFKEVPSDLFILPPAREKDQAEVRATVAAMKEFLRLYPKSSFVPEAQRVEEEARRRLAEHELYVAEFYAKREKWNAVVNRLRIVVDQYAGLGLDEEAYFGLHEAYLKLNDAERAKETLRAIIQKLPGTSAAAKAQRLLGS